MRKTAQPGRENSEPSVANYGHELDDLLESHLRFPDGGAFRIEIPSAEGPGPLATVLAEAKSRDVPLHRISQGSGVSMLSDAEIADMLGQCDDAAVELCLFLGPRATWDIGAAGLSPSRGIGARVRGGDQLGYSIDDAQRAVALGVRCLLIADEGVLWALHSARAGGQLPADVRFKMSALSGPANPSSFRVIERLGADSINVPGDLSILHVAQLRRSARAPIDLYIESPDSLGGFVRHHEVGALVTVGAPIYLKFSVRGAPEIYPMSAHMLDVAQKTGQERVRRAALALDLLRRQGLMAGMSPVGSHEIGELCRFPTDDHGGWKIPIESKTAPT